MQCSVKGTHGINIGRSLKLVVEFFRGGCGLKIHPTRVWEGHHFGAGCLETVLVRTCNEARTILAEAGHPEFPSDARIGIVVWKNMSIGENTGSICLQKPSCEDRLPHSSYLLVAILHSIVPDSVPVLIHPSTVNKTGVHPIFQEESRNMMKIPSWNHSVTHITTSCPREWCAMDHYA